LLKEREYRVGKGSTIKLVGGWGCYFE